MRRLTGCLLMLGIVSVSGCAWKGQAQALNRLKTDLGLLDQRISQLERASLQQASLGPSFDRNIVEPVASAPESSRVKVSVTSPSAAAIKPSKKEIQQALKNAGFYNGPIDGKIGSQTQEAIRQFQQVHGLKVDGVVGKHTWEQLAPYATLASDSGELGAAETLK